MQVRSKCWISATHIETICVISSFFLHISHRYDLFHNLNCAYSTYLQFRSIYIVSYQSAGHTGIKDRRKYWILRSYQIVLLVLKKSICQRSPLTILYRLLNSFYYLDYTPEFKRQRSCYYSVKYCIYSVEILSMSHSQKHGNLCYHSILRERLFSNWMTLIS